ncbi:MAG: ATP-grasp domain-containing protein [Proteobacteria bacterium]|nr:ATP-grasp domain-containing protein [Pseudomonadota bacterium]
MAPLKVLIATTTWWPSAAYLAIAFADAGANLYSLSPIGNPVRKLTFSRGAQTYSARDPHGSLVRAISDFRPDLIIPTDDRAVSHIHSLYRRAASFSGTEGPIIQALIERSLGQPASYGVSGTRHAFLETMRTRGVAVPLGAELRTLEDVRTWCAAHAPPWVIKAEGSWGGSGVRIVSTVGEAAEAFQDLSSPLPLHKALRLLLVDRDPFTVTRFFHRQKRNVMAQAHAEGIQVTCMAAAWQGRLVGSVTAEVISTQGRVGASTLLQLTDNPQIEAAAAVTAEHLGLSGFFGLDFIVEEATGRCLLIEMNPRATQLGHIRVRGADLATRLCRAAGAASAAPGSRPDHPRAVAFFPQCLRFGDGGGARQALPVEDVPWNEPELVEELLRLPWTKRGALARLEALVRKNDAFGSAIRPERISEVRAELQRRRPKATSHDRSTSPTSEAAAIDA